jgi:dTDP-4-amino-4,6-dideoxygalactose transaminase
MTHEPVAFLDLGRVLAPLHAPLRDAFDRMLDHAGFVLGKEVAAFERALGEALGCAGVVGVSSGTDALLAAFLALDLPEDAEILLTPFTFISSATSILRAGLRPVFVDLPPGGFHPTVEDFAAAWGPKTAGVLVVHLFGEPVATAEIAALCAQRGGVLIEDCAQAIGAVAVDGRAVGLAGRAGTLSFFPAKNLGALGDGGAVISNDLAWLAEVRAIRQHGCHVRYAFSRLGGNFRLDAIQAAMLGVLLPELEGWIDARRANAVAYLRDFAALEAAGSVVLPAFVPGHAWNQFVIRTERRDALAQALSEAQIGSAIYYPSALHRAKALAKARPAESMPNAERCCDEVLALPIYPGLREAERARVVEVVQATLTC